MKIKWYVGSLASVLLFSFPGFAQTVSVSVPGTSNPYLAGMPNGSLAPPDQAPYQSPVEVTGLNFSKGGAAAFTNVTGGVSNMPFCDGTNCSSGDGNILDRLTGTYKPGVIFFDHDAGAQNGMSDIHAPINSLVGVFLTDAMPSLSTPPSKLDFEAFGLNFTTLAPQPQQVFFIGDGMTSNGTVQQFSIPSSATRLFLGTMDGNEWLNNSGAIMVDVAQVVPEPETYAMFLAGLGLMAAMSRRRKIS